VVESQDILLFPLCQVLYETEQNTMVPALRHSRPSTRGQTQADGKCSKSCKNSDFPGRLRQQCIMQSLTWAWCTQDLEKWMVILQSYRSSVSS